jgi:dolichyl-phosphate-mannose-protein mannosyltransferase
MASVQQRNANTAEKARMGKSSEEPSNRNTPDKTTQRKDYGSEGVTDNDIFLLPGSDFQLLGVLTMIATVIRLFRISQPTSVVFDEVQ